MARNSDKVDSAVPATDADAVDLAALLSGAHDNDHPGDDVMLSATDETIALLNSAFASDWRGIDSFSAWNFIAFG